MLLKLGCPIICPRGLFLKPAAGSTAYLLISHGSRDPRPQEAMNQLAELVRQRLGPSFQSDYGKTGQSDGFSSQKNKNGSSELRNMRNSTELAAQKVPSSVLTGLSLGGATTVMTRSQPQMQVQTQHELNAGAVVETACLELSTLPLRDRIYEFGCRLIDAGIRELKLLPVFLMAGVHVMEDIPAEIEAARRQLGKSIQLTVCGHLGSHPHISAVLEKRLTSVPAESSLLVAHGSRRPKGNKGIENLAKALNTRVAYWAVPPDIETQVIELMQQGCQKLTILPYFLFAGGITDAIAHRTEELAERFPKVQFRLLPTLGATPEMAELSVEMIRAV